MNERPTSVKEQAARMILGEIAPLVEKLDEVATTIRESHDHLADDVRQLAAIVTTVENALSKSSQEFQYLTGQARQVQATVARFESAPAPARGGPSAAAIAGMMLGSAMLAALLAAGAVLAYDRHTAEQARIGKAVMRAYPQLDDSTRQKLDAAIRKAG